MAQAPTKAPLAPPPAMKPTVAEIVNGWASDLTPTNAPKPADKGPLAWVRETKAAELIEALNKADYK